MTTRSARSASRRIAVRTLAVSRSSGSERAVTNWRTNAARARSAWARTASVTPGRHEVHHDDRGVVALGERVGDTERQLGVGPAADRDQDPPDVPRPALLDDGDVARRLAHDLVDGGADDRRVRVPVGPGLAAPAEDHQVRLLLGGGLDDPGGGVAPDAHQRVDHGPLGHVVHHLLEQAPGLAGPRRALGQRHALGHLDDPERRQLARPRVHAATAPIRISSSAVSGFATGMTIRDGQRPPVIRRRPALGGVERRSSGRRGRA